LTFSGPVTLANGTRTLNSASAGNIIFSGSIGDNGAGYGVNKAGTGTIVFSGANVYNGNTNVNAGALLANAPAGNSSTGNGAVNVNSGGILAGIGSITGNNAQVTVAGGAKISAGTGVAASSKPGNLTTTGGDGSTSFSQAWVGASTAATSGSYVAKFNPNNLGSPGATVGGANPTATADPGGPGANWDELTMTTLNLQASSTNQFNLTTVSVTPGYGTANPFNSTGAYSWPVAVITNGISGFYINASPAVGTNSQNQAALQAAIAPLLRLDPTGLVAATGVSNASSFSVGVAPDPNNGSFEDVVVNYSPAPEPGSLAMVGLGLGAMLLRRRRL
jgi:autotransporter-associated beta strand protein